MRAVTFSDPKVARAVERSFVCVWKNIRPDRKFPKELFEGEAGQRIIMSLRPGTGATNICAHLATADGRIVHAIPGFAGPEMYLRELEFGLEVAKALKGEAIPEDLKRLYAKRLENASSDQEWNQAALKPALSWLVRSPLPPLDQILTATSAGPGR